MKRIHSTSNLARSYPIRVRLLPITLKVESATLPCSGGESSQGGEFIGLRSAREVQDYAIRLRIRNYVR